MGDVLSAQQGETSKGGLRLGQVAESLQAFGFDDECSSVRCDLFVCRSGMESANIDDN
ncbi:hypothetical protein [Mycolicibacterium baixiangningiae]|uniref:hypothetical protein n=1 Tax=Mycolicibacterium baixiangningiae TaxID=2761578 RepID=UPI001D024E49|nr:hypothetical protein [Mycolicibacterium baixiangningiae]